MRSEPLAFHKGVNQDLEQTALERLIPILAETENFRSGMGKSITKIGHYAGIVKIDDKHAIALKTDGVGTKILVAQLMDSYDTIGIDCVAMVVNDIICTGARPLSMLDYIAVQDPDPFLIGEIGKGLREGARQASVNFVGGEIAQIGDMLKGEKEKDGRAFDLVGMGIGHVHPSKIIDGTSLREGDVVVGIGSSGIHSNGLTWARQAFVTHNGSHESISHEIGEELLRPTAIYVPEIMEMIDKKFSLKNVANITSEGLFNLSRVGMGFGYTIDKLPKPQPIFKLIKDKLKKTDEDMYRMYNMGIGMCYVVPKDEVDDSISIVEKHGHEAREIGFVTKDESRQVRIPELNVVRGPTKTMRPSTSAGQSL